MIRFNPLLWLVLPLISAVVLAAQPAQAQTVIYRSRIVISDDVSSEYDDYGHRYNRYPSYRRGYRYPSVRYPSSYPNTVIRGEIENSTLVRPTIINSTIEDSTLVNPVIVSPRSSQPIQRTTIRQQNNPACMAFSEIRLACQ